MPDTTKIVIIDDDLDILYTVSEICEFCDYKVFTANNGEDGYQLTLKEKPDLVIVDYHMPGWDGMLTVKKIHAALPNVLIMVLTVDENQEIADKFLSVGASDFSVKPIKAPDLIARIKINLQLNEMKTHMHSKTEQAYIEKGISVLTLDKIRIYLKKQLNTVTIQDVSTGVSLSYKTVHRYIQYMVDNHEVEIIHQYGTLGRPKNQYKLFNS